MPQVLNLVSSAYNNKEIKTKVQARLLQIVGNQIGNHGNIVDTNIYKFMEGSYESKLLINRTLALCISIDNFDLSQSYDDSQISNFVDNRWLQAFSIAV